jgi:hypothetical protein
VVGASIVGGAGVVVAAIVVVGARVLVSASVVVGASVDCLLVAGCLGHRTDPSGSTSCLGCAIVCLLHASRVGYVACLLPSHCHLPSTQDRPKWVVQLPLVMP